MKLTYLSLDLDLTLPGDMITTLIVEEPAMFRKLIYDMIKATKGEDTDWVLSTERKTLELKKDSYIISDIFDLDVNNRTLLTRLNQRLSDIAVEEVELLYDINQKIQQLLFTLEESLPIEVNHDELITAQGLVKLGNFVICDDGFDDIGKVANYIEIVMELLHPKLIILINTRSYMTEKEVGLLFDTLLCKKIPVLCIERNCVDNVKLVENKEVIYTIDSDMCVF